MIRLSVILIITALFIVAMDRSWVIGTVRIPPPGRFLDPFHGFWHNTEPEKPRLPARLHDNGLGNEVTVVWDSLLIPHIYAQSDSDLYFVQGYVTAMHRLWQMEFQTHAAAGRLSEILGAGPDNAILDYDRQQRRLGMVYAAENAMKAMMDNDTARRVIQAYVRGVNAYINRLRYRDLPLEYKLLDYRPEPWTELKCALLLRSMAQTLNMGDKDLEMTNALAVFGPELVDLLYPEREKVGDAIVEKPGHWKFTETSSSGKSITSAISGTPTPCSGEEVFMASNNWAVSGSKTQSGFPILCNDPHLNTTLPSIWYAVHLNTPEMQVMGVSLPGAPCVIIGFNDSIAWGVTNAQRDLVDWYRITYADGNKSSYVLDGKAVPIQQRIETFRIRGNVVFNDTVRYTHWGPIPYDEHFRPDNGHKDCAFRWIAHDESEELLTFYKLNRAHNHHDFMKALDHFSSPAQNFIYASTSGDIAIRIQGKFPVRGKNEGRFLLDGSRSSSAPIGYIPYEHNLMDKNPERGFVSSANQYPADSTYPYYINAVSYEAYRNRRINNVLRQANNVTIADMMALQNDTYSIKAREALDVMMPYIQNAELTDEEQQLAAHLNTWDCRYQADQHAPCYFEAWWSNLYNLLWDEMRNDTLALPLPTAFQTIYLMKNRKDLYLYDRRETPERETLSDLITMALKKAFKDINEWKSKNPDKELNWGNYKDTYIEHLLRLSPLSRHAFHGGHANAVNASSRKHGPSWRMVVSLKPGNVEAWGVYPGGQSGNAGSPCYDNLLRPWSQGQYFKLSFWLDRDTALLHAYHITNFAP
jgi:penicillin amidase